VLIHVGFAMSKISEQDALDQMPHAESVGRSGSGYARKFKATAWKTQRTRKPREALKTSLPKDRA